MSSAENRTYGVPEFAGTEVNQHSGKLKGLSGYLQNHHDTKVGDKTQQTSTTMCLYFHMDEKATDHMVLYFHMDKNQLNLCEANAVRTPTQCHIDLACNTSYHFAASRMVFPRVLHARSMWH